MIKNQGLDSIKLNLIQPFKKVGADRYLFKLGKELKMNQNAGLMVKLVTHKDGSYQYELCNDEADYVKTGIQFNQLIRKLVISSGNKKYFPHLYYL